MLKVQMAGRLLWWLRLSSGKIAAEYRRIEIDLLAATARHAELHFSRTNLDRFRKTLEANRSDALLRKSLEAGNISIIDFFQEQRYWFESFDKYLSDEGDYFKNLVGLIRYYW
jgi:hypothetical protein